MKKLFITFVMLFTIFLAACSSVTVAGKEADEEIAAPALEQDSAENAAAEGPILLESGVWPQNEYTAGLPIPSGTVSWALLDQQYQNCAISLTGVTEADYAEYIKSLEQNGFNIIEEAEEEIADEDDVAIGTLYFDGEKWLSISRIPDCLSIYIAFAES